MVQPSLMLLTLQGCCSLSLTMAALLKRDTRFSSEWLVPTAPYTPSQISHPHSGFFRAGPGPVPRSMSDSCLVESQYQQRLMAHSPNHSPMEGDVDYSLINSMLKLLHFEKVRHGRPLTPTGLICNI